MGGYKDPAIKLFGKMIKLGSDSNGDFNLSPHDIAAAASTDDADCDSTFSDQNTPCSKQSQNRGQQKSSNNEEERSSNSVVLEGCKTPASQKKNPKSVSKKEDQSDQTSSTQSQDQNTPKKPDKILPCPRCNSITTKFCYFNNYNVNQPRHFCKNCQRYWTAGGTMRNVPVGAGRRKNKSSSSPASHHRTLLVPEPPNGLTHHGLVLAFGPNNNSSPLSYDQSNCVISYGKENLGSKLANPNLAWSPIPWGSRIPVSLCSSAPNWAPPTWNWQWVATPQSCPDQSSLTTNLDSRSLGKHARDGTLLRVTNSNNNKKNKENAENGRVVMPKTLRIDDPSEAAKSSIWDTLGIKNEKVGCSPNGFFRGLHQSSKGIIEHNHERRNHPSDVEGSHMLLQSNPAAFSRSITFNECGAHSSC